MIDYSLVISREDIHTDKACCIGCESFDHSRIMEAYENENITDEFIEKINRLLEAVGTVEDYEIEAIIKWLKLNKGKSYFIMGD